MSETRIVHRSQQKNRKGDYKYYDILEGKVKDNPTHEHNLDYDHQYGPIHKGGN